MTTPSEFRSANSYRDADGDPIRPMTVTGGDLLILALDTVQFLTSRLIFLAKGDYNLRVERKAIEMEMRADLEAITR